jgi:hypothetical protein
VGRRRLTFTVSSSAVGARTTLVRGSLVRVAGRGARTNRRGRVTLTVRLRHRGLYVARATARGMRTATARIRVRPRARSSPRFPR